jgi:hypothetical protein
LIRRLYKAYGQWRNLRKHLRGIGKQKGGKMSDKNEHQHKELSDADLKRISEIAAAIKFGSVTLIIQDGRIVQIEKNEKIRLI